LNHQVSFIFTPVMYNQIMDDFTKEELEEALRSLTSTIGKCEKVYPKLKQGSSQATLLNRRIKAFRIASALIEREMGHNG